MRKVTGNRRVIRAISLGLAAFLAVSAPMTVCAEPGGESTSVSGEAGGESGGTGGSESSGADGSESSTSRSESGTGSGESSGTGSSEAGNSGITEQKTTEKVDNGDGSQTVTTTTTVTTDRTIEAGSTEEKDSIVKEQTDSQEELKQDIEGKGGTYEYEINVTDQSTTEHKSEGTDTKEEAEKLAEELRKNGSNSDITVDEKDNTGTITIQKDGFRSEEEAWQYIDQVTQALKATGGNENIVSDVTLVTKEVPGEMKTDASEGKGYTLRFDRYDENEKVYYYTVDITGGLEEIQMPLFDEMDCGMQPGDSFGIKITVKNESNDDYIVEDYNYAQSGPYKYIVGSKWDPSLGEEMTRFYAGKEYVAYIPAEDLKEGKYTGIANCYPSYNTIVRWYMDNNKDVTNANEARKIIRNNPEIYLAYYNDKLGVAGTDQEYTDLYTAWAAYFNEFCWDLKIGEGEELQDLEKYFEKVNQFVAGESVEIPYTLSLDGPNTDNTYQCTYWSFVTELILRIKPLAPANYQANIQYDHTYHYQVNYDVKTESYIIDIDGVGSYQVKERVITRLPDDDDKGGGGSKSGGSSSKVVEVGDVTVPLTDSIVLPDEAVPLADSVMIPDEDVPLADSVPQTGDDALSVLPGLTAGLAAIAGALRLRRKERE